MRIHIFINLVYSVRICVIKSTLLNFVQLGTTEKQHEPIYREQ